MRPGTLKPSTVGMLLAGPFRLLLNSSLAASVSLRGHVSLFGVFWKKGVWVLVHLISKGVLEELLPHVVASCLILPCWKLSGALAVVIYWQLP